MQAHLPTVRVYLAGPSVFRPDAIAAGRRLKDICARFGLTGVYPLDAPLDLSGSGAAAVASIRASCCAQIHSCDAVLADLSPFRGPHADDGTAFEVGYAHALQKPVVAYTRAPSPLLERIAWSRTGDGRARDADGHEVEDFGHAHNAMLAGSIHSLHADAENAAAALAVLLGLTP